MMTSQFNQPAMKTELVYDPDLADAMPKGGYPDHPIASKLPMLEGDEMDKFAKDIADHGQREPVIIHENQVVDGRNRQKAALMRGIRPQFRHYNQMIDGGSILELIISQNLRRRHLSPDQLGAYAVEFMPFLEKEAADRRTANLPKAPNGAFGDSQVLTPEKVEKAPPARKGKSAAHAAAKVGGTSARTVERMKKLKETDPEKFEAIKAGKKPAKVKTSGEAVEKAINRVEKVCGKPQADRIRAGSLMKNRQEVIRYAALPDDKMLDIRTWISKGRSVKWALQIMSQDLIAIHTIRHAMHIAVGHGGEYTHDVYDDTGMGELSARVTIKILHESDRSKAKRERLTTKKKARGK
jgi:hypothetical protein